MSIDSLIRVTCADAVPRLTAVYFKSLYSPSPEVKEAAHDGLKVLLAHQSRLPKELL